MFSFEGQYKSKPNQSLGGSSRKEGKDALLQRAREDREKREASRRRIQAATSIQSGYRAYKSKQHTVSLLRRDFDERLRTLSKGRISPNTLLDVIKMLNFFYKASEDAERLTGVCGSCLREKEGVLRAAAHDPASWLLPIRTLLLACCRHLEYVSRGPEPLALGMRMLEVFSDPAQYGAAAAAAAAAVTRPVCCGGLYRSIRELLEARVPSSMEPSPSPPTPLAESLLQLAVRPLSALPPGQHRSAVLLSLAEALFKPAFSEQVSDYLLLALAQPAACFPVTQLVAALHDTSAGGSSPWLLNAVIILADQNFGSFSDRDCQMYLSFISSHMAILPEARARPLFLEAPDSDSEEEETSMPRRARPGDQARRACLSLLASQAHVKAVLRAAATDSSTQVVTSICRLCHELLYRQRQTVHGHALLSRLAYLPGLLQCIWQHCSSISTTSAAGTATPLLSLVSRGLTLPGEELDKVVPALDTFCSLFSHALLSCYDSDFFSTRPDPKGRWTFMVQQLVDLSGVLREVCVGVVEAAHPDSRPVQEAGTYHDMFRRLQGQPRSKPAGETELTELLNMWAHLFKVSSAVLRQLHARDTRRRYCGAGHWHSNHVRIHAGKQSQLYKAYQMVFVKRPFGAFSTLNLMKMEEEFRLSNMEARTYTILTELPFVVPFQERVTIFHELLTKDREESQGDLHHFNQGPSINIMVRRNYLYEDAFEKLSPTNEPNLKLKMRVQLVNFAGLDEAGIDGGGLFREFLSELLKTAFDPNRGLFAYTSDKLLYPNPGASSVEPNFLDHFYFLGRILGKAIYDNLLVELPFASFFLSKILSRYHGDLDIHHLESLDPEMNKHLLSLKSYSGDLADLGLDFTVAASALGETRVVELVPGGRNIPVTNDNVITYIHRVADYRLNKQMRPHCSAFRQGLADVVNLEALRMFDSAELQTLISGALVPIDVDDLRTNTNYSGGYTAEHGVIAWFWAVVGDLSDEQRRKLLKFVTSCSRPPLLGFKDLYPPLCIQRAVGESDRLPTASTCMNLLKLPEFPDIETLREKLLYAIESDAGFELS